MTRRQRLVAALGVLLGAAVAVWLLTPLLVGQGTAPAPPALPGSPDGYSYRELVKRVLPAVVSIEAQVRTAARSSGQRRPPRSDREPPFFKQLPEELRKQLPPELRRFFEEMPFEAPFEMPEPPVRGFGSGFFIDPRGILVTNYHVVAGASQVTVILQNGQRFTSRDIQADQRSDLAIVRLHVPRQQSFPYLEFGDSSKMEIGDPVLAIGAPFGLTGSVTHGIISGKGRSGLALNMYEDFLQTDAAINPGNSGGPLINLQGKVIGINSAIKSRSGGFQGVGLAIASNLAKNVIQALIKEGVVHRGYLGVEIRDLDEKVAQHLGLKERTGVVVSRVLPETPAAKAGLQAGDIILALNGQPVKDAKSLQAAVAALPLRQTASLTILRDGRQQQVSVMIEEQPREFGLARGGDSGSEESAPEGSVHLEKLGLQLTDLTPELRQRLGFSSKAQGALISRVAPDSLAAEAGLQPHQLITKVNNQVVTSAAAAQKALEQASLEKGILLQVQDPSGRIDYVLLQQVASGSRR